MSKTLITIEKVTKSYPKIGAQKHLEVLRDIHLSVYQGEFLVLLGPSGCGKSTLLRILAGFDTATSGSVLYDAGFDHKNINFVFQNFGLLPWLSVFQNVELGLIGRGMPKHQRLHEVDTMLQKLGLFSFRDHRPHELSGGMKQRVGLARAFVTKPQIIFLDEPFSELDFFTARSLREVLLAMWKEQGTTVVMVSHYIDEAIALADRIAVFSNRPSTIAEIFENTLTRPRDARSEIFFREEDKIIKEFESLKHI